VGPIGPAGATGPTGATGTAAPVEFAYIYNVSAETVPLEADVTFDTNGVLTAGLTHAPGATGITFASAGYYTVGFTVSAVEPNQMGLFVNGVVVPGTVHGSGAGTQQTTGQTIIRVDAGDVLTLRNHTSAAAVGLQPLAGGTQPSTNAAIRIVQLT